MASVCPDVTIRAPGARSSLGGGASLEMIENDGHLPGVDVLR